MKLKDDNFRNDMKRPSMNCDAFAEFSMDKTGKGVSLKMKEISPGIDFSYNFQDLDLRRVK